ncbi:hypothetical protein Syun_007003 [Stephania yunnanensis]|uniref:Uncharacterized protein n=1 Tax=Stephania yunnanensis TaxID=152371 RepID=A0AAP0KXL9_9MAGN
MSELMKKMKSVLSFKNPTIKFESPSSLENQPIYNLKPIEIPSKIDLQNISEISYSDIEQHFKFGI